MESVNNEHLVNKCYCMHILIQQFCHSPPTIKKSKHLHALKVIDITS